MNRHLVNAHETLRKVHADDFGLHFFNPKAVIQAEIDRLQALLNAAREELAKS